MKMSKKEHAKKLSELAGVDKVLFKGRKPSAELKAMRKEWDREFDRRIQRMLQKPSKAHKSTQNHA